jgi:beta-N-acetylhexosaminidase
LTSLRLDNWCPLIEHQFDQADTGGGIMTTATRARRMAASLLCLLCLLAAGCQGLAAQGGHAGSGSARKAASCPVPPLRAQLAQLLLVGFPGTTIGTESRWVVRQGVGGVILYQRNVVSARQVRSLVRQLQSAATVPLEVAVDQEPGRRVARLAGMVPETPSARQLGRRSPEEIFRYGREVGRSLAALGVTTDLAPVLDITLAGRDTVIGDRSFGGDPATVSRAGVAYMRGLTAGGVTTVGKHFPGHGTTAVDSHRTLPVVDVSAARLMAWDLTPFKEAIHAHLPAVMVGHLLLPRLDPDWPATFSPVLVNLLRDRLAFRGLVVSDALEMGAVANAFSLPVAAELALAAGLDQLLLSESYRAIPEVLDQLEEAVAAGRLSKDHVREAYRRVQHFKGQGC